MPRIPIVTAEGQAAVVQLPTRVPTPDYTGAYNFGRNLSEFSHQLNQITHALKKQQDDIDIAELVGIFHGKLKENALAVQTEYPLEQGAKFAERMSVVRQELVERARNKIVSAGIIKYANNQLPLETAKVHGDALTYMTQEQIAKVDARAPAVSKMAAEAASPKNRTSVIAFYDSIIAGLVKSRSITPLEGQNKKEHFRVRSEVDFARHLSRIDYEAFKYQDEQGAFANVPTRDLDAIKRQAESVELQKQKTAEKALTDAVKTHHDGVVRYLIGKRAVGSLTPEDVAEWKDILHPTELEHMQEEYRKMALGIDTGDIRAQVITQEDYRDRTVNLTVREKAVYQLRRLNLIDKKEYDHRLSYLDSERTRQESNIRADQSSDAAKVLAIQSKRDSHVRDRVNELLKTTGPFENFNFAVSTVKDQFMTEYDNMVVTGGGKYDPEDAYRILKAKYLPLIPERLNPLMESLRRDLQKYPTKQSLATAQGALSPYEFNSLVMKQRELYALEAYIKILKETRKNNPKPTGGTER